MSCKSCSFKCQATGCECLCHEEKEGFEYGKKEGLEEGKRLGAIGAYEILLKLNIGNCQTNDWLRTQIKLMKELGK